MKHHCHLPLLCTPPQDGEGAEMPTCLLLSSESVSTDGPAKPRERQSCQRHRQKCVQRSAIAGSQVSLAGSDGFLGFPSECWWFEGVEQLCRKLMCCWLPALVWGGWKLWGWAP